MCSREAHNWAVQNGKEENRHTGEDDIVHSCTDAIHEGLSTEAIVKLEVEQEEPKDHILVE